ncbi:MAG: hypothetical protein HKO59_08655, partial [Phycisphaerales bacterium]|nr:hypothetical protein [Phycisphaerales bacterium]
MNDDMHENELDILIMRVVEGDASTEEWDTLATRAAADQSVWRLLATAQRDQMDLARLGRVAASVADGVDAPVPRPQPAPVATTAWTGWLGWAVAAVVFLALVINSLTPPQPPAEGGVQA